MSNTKNNRNRYSLHLSTPKSIISTLETKIIHGSKAFRIMSDINTNANIRFYESSIKKQYRSANN